jgi:hypothetical protein
MLDSAKRRAVERRAMDLVMATLASQNWHCEDVSNHSSYDSHCTRAGEDMRSKDLWRSGVSAPKLQRGRACSTGPQLRGACGGPWDHCQRT